MNIQYLGLHKDENFNFKGHIEQLKDKVKKFTTLFYLIRHKWSKNCLRVLYQPFMFNYIYYCAETYGRTSKTIVQSLQKVQNSSLRALQFRYRYYTINEMHKKYRILKVTHIKEYKVQKTYTLYTIFSKCYCRTLA